VRSRRTTTTIHLTKLARATFRLRRRAEVFPLVCLIGASLAVNAAPAFGEVSESIRAIIPRASIAPKIDGKLEEYDNAFCTPVEYFHTDAKNRAAQFYYVWDDMAFYLAVRTLDEHPFSPRELFWTGDAVEWYFDTRPDTVEKRLKWGQGAVHCFLSPVNLDAIKPQFSLRPGYEEAIPQQGIQLASRRWEHGLEYEFCLPWSNFPKYRPRIGGKLHLDAELSYSDGISRTFRSFVFGNPLSVECPANLAYVQLGDDFKRSDWSSCGPLMMPMRLDTPWTQSGVPQVQASIAMPPNEAASVGRVTFQLLDTKGLVIAEFDSNEELMVEGSDFRRSVASWPVELAAAGAYHVQAIVYDREGSELTRVTPRMVSVNMERGY
jgi:hypothetical protein